MKYNSQLRPATYQLVPLLKLIHNNLNCVLVSDGVGVGKTISAGYILFSLTKKLKQSAVVICPPSLLIKWKDELSEKFTLRSVIVSSSEEFATMENELHSKTRHDAVYIIPSSMIKKFSLKSNTKISVIVFDEIHNFRNNETSGFNAALSWSKYAQFRIGLSATPINNSMNDFISELNILLPHYSWDAIGIMIEDFWNRNKIKITNALITRFTKENLGIHFAKRIIENYDVSFPSEYASRIRRIISLLPTSKNSFFEKVTYYRLAASSSEAFRKSLEIPDKLIENDPKISLVQKILKRRRISRWLIFCEFTETAKILRKELAKDWDVFLMTGETPLFERHKIINGFRSTNNSILIMTPVGSEGLDIQFCNAIMNYDLHWNPMKIEQRIGRIDRVGQKSNEIIVSNLIVRGSIDERVLQVIERKLALISNSVFNVPPILSKKSKIITNLFDKETMNSEFNVGKNFLKSIKYWESLPVIDYSILNQINKKYCNLDELKKITDDKPLWFKKPNEYKKWISNLENNSNDVKQRIEYYL